MIDLDATTRRQVETVLDRFLSDVEVRLVGSRARRGAKRHADIDLLVMRPTPLLPLERAMINTAFEESKVPFKVDVLEWSRLTPGFRAQLLRAGAPVLHSASLAATGQKGETINPQCATHNAQGRTPVAH